MSSTPAQLRTLGKNGPSVNPVGLGLMAIGGNFYGRPSTQEEVDKLLTSAYECGSRFWDTSDVYGDSQKLIGNWLANNPSARPDITLCTKIGFNRQPTDNLFSGPCSDPSYLPVALESALSQLQTSYVDVLYQHRVDPKVPIEIVLEALRPAVESGKVRYLGLSESSADTLRRARAVQGIGEKVIVVQMEYSPFTLDVEKAEGIAAVCEELGVSLVAYSPLGRGMLSGRFRSRADFEPTDARLRLPRFSEENFSKNLIVADKIQAIATKLGITNSQATLAWILGVHPNWVVIPGSRTPSRVHENTGAGEIKISPEDMATIRKVVDEADIVGPRYVGVFADMLNGTSIPLSEWKA